MRTIYLLVEWCCHKLILASDFLPALSLLLILPHHDSINFFKGTKIADRCSQRWDDNRMEQEETDEQSKRHMRHDNDHWTIMWQLYINKPRRIEGLQISKIILSYGFNGRQNSILANVEEAGDKDDHWSEWYCNYLGLAGGRESDSLVGEVTKEERIDPFVSVLPRKHPTNDDGFPLPCEGWSSNN